MPVGLVSEAEFQSAVVELAEALGWHWWHFADSRRPGRGGLWVGDVGARGWPDLVLVRHNRHLLRELKTDGGRLSKAQQQAIQLLAAAGFDVAVWRPADWDDIEADLNRR